MTAVGNVDIKEILFSCCTVARTLYFHTLLTI